MDLQTTERHAQRFGLDRIELDEGSKFVIETSAGAVLETEVPKGKRWSLFVLVEIGEFDKE